MESWVKHYLHVDRSGDAKRRGKLLASDGFTVTVRRSGDGEKCLILGSEQIRELIAERSRFALALD